MPHSYHRTFANIALALVAAIILTVGMALSPANASSLADIVNGTFKLHDGTGRGYCSTVFLKNTPEGALFLTAGHCAGEKDMNVRFPVMADDKQTVKSERVVYLDVAKIIKDKDVAVLIARDESFTVKAKGIDVATVEEANTMYVGYDLIACGYPAAQIITISKGTFSGEVPDPGFGLKTTMYQTSVSIAGGMSGGGLFAKFGNEWKLVGTATGSRNDNVVMTYFQTTATVREVLKSYL